MASAEKLLPPNIKDERGLFHYLATSKKLRTKRKDCTTSCSACFTRDIDLGQPLRKCSKCRSAFYCSKDCQIRDWPVHKKTCGDAGFPKRIHKLVTTLLSNPLMLVQLQSCFILAFDLIQNWRSNELFLAQINVAVEPSDIADFTDIFLGNGSSKKIVPGMLQVNRFTPVTDEKIISAERRSFWQTERDRADAAGFRDDPVVILDIGYADVDITISFPTRIPPQFKTVVRSWMEGGFMTVSSLGERINSPFTIDNCLECINMTIAGDKKNKLLLRTEMEPSDIQIIRDAAAGSHSVPAIMLHAKIARELPYRSIYQTFVERRKAATGVAPSIPPLNMVPC
ncbi:hypothetical protein MSAN_02299200 [Mycena sanguinolenta]|uniref:MYND-type domain-containing protein n=1 Tax=Mycena sanguinolenta TaxID=230812 RepID=A0A8H6X8C0_9AGAR|nr:hypothetical protein MSAN_02299200 [Mycena sanguinolenta]